MDLLNFLQSCEQYDDQQYVDHTKLYHWSKI